MKTYEIINHTADVGIKVYGKNLEQLFLNAARAMFEVMIEETKRKSIFQKEEQKKFLVNKRASGIEDVFVAWLSELLYLFSTEGLIMDKADIQALDSEHIYAEVAGRIFNPDSCRVKTEIKAVTFHELKIEQTDKGYQAQIIFDV
jgi:SHS2 domain-containing protein